MLNLVRKELRLQKPLFSLAVLFCLCWFATFALLIGGQVDTCTTILSLLAATYVPLAVILAGCVSLGEEKSLDLTGWHLTLPVSCLRQWLIKFTVSIVVCFLLGVVLPYALMALAPYRVKIEPGDWLQNLGRQDPALTLLLACGGMFALSFWAMTLFRNTVVAVLTTVAGVFLLGACASLGAWLSAKGVGIGLLELVVTRFEPNPAANFNWCGFQLVVSVASATVVALIQSAIQFRRAQAPKAILWKYPLILAGVVFLAAYGCPAPRADF